MDSPPILAVSDSLTLAGAVDTVLMLARWRKSRIDELNLALSHLALRGVRIAGTVINDVHLGRHSSSGAYGAAYYYSKIGKYYSN
jgi:Mrp family chromosome partitioning ATPase